MKFLFHPFFGRLILLIAIGFWAGENPARAAGFTLTPTAVSNTYSGKLTLVVTNLPVGGSVVVQKFLDRNGNGVVDAGDSLMQQFNLTDGQAGMVIGGVTNINVPGDDDTTAGQITCKLRIPDGDFAQTVIGNYLFVISSPTGAFSPVTNSFAVTNFPFAQQLAGTVLNNGVAAPGSVVIVFPAPTGGSQGLGTPVALTLVDNSGHYTVALPPGSYLPFALGNNAVADVQASPIVTLNASQTVNTNLTLTNGTTTISGQVVDASNPSVGLPGLFLPVSTKTGLVASTSTDTNGNFTVGVLPGTWKFDGEPSGLALHGYVGYQGGTNVNSGSSVTAGFYKATALVYGQVVDSLGNPLPDIDIYLNDNSGTFQSDGYSDNKGNYVIGAVGGLNGDTWNVQVSTGNGSTTPTNYVFSQPVFDQNGGTNLTAGQAVLVNFTGLLATNVISGNVQFNGSNVVGVGVNANATINGLNYSAHADTDANGNYSFNVANGNWSVSVNCNGGNDSLDAILGAGTYQCPNNQNVTINNNNSTTNFSVQPCGGVQIINPTTTNLPAGQMGSYYSFQFQASSCNNNFTWTQTAGTLPNGLTLYSGGAFNGTPGNSGPFTFTVQVTDGNGHSTNETVSLIINPSSSPLQINTGSLPYGTNGTFYSQTVQASGGVPPYSWSIPNYSANPPANLTLATNGVLSGVPAASGNFSFYVRVTDSTAATMDQLISLNIVNPPLTITNATLPTATAGVPYHAQLGATGGTPPYSWVLAGGSASLPPGLSLSGAGLISGTATNTGLFNFLVQVQDMAAAFQNQPLAINVFPRPSLSQPALLAPGQFQILLAGGTNQNYTLQMTTNLAPANWVTLYTTNNPTTNSFFLIAPNATNRQGFYRVLVGP